LRIAVVGTGNFATSHLARWCQIPGVQVRAVIGRNSAKAKALATQYGIANAFVVNQDIFTLLGQVDVLDIATIPATHIDLARRLRPIYDAVLIEKPIDVNMQKAIDFVSQVRSERISIGVISQLRYLKQFKELKSLFTAGVLGELLHFDIVQCIMRTRDYYTNGSGWRDDQALAGGGIMMSHTIHRLNLVLTLIDYSVERVYAVSGPRRHAQAVEETVSVIFVLRNGVTGHLYATSTSPYETDQIVFHFALGTVTLDLLTPALLVKHKGAPPKYPNSLRDDSASKSTSQNAMDPLTAQLSEFSNALRAGQRIEQNVREALGDLNIIHAVYQSIENGEPVKVNEVENYD
jgi:predicted dehydrogenase